MAEVTKTKNGGTVMKAKIDLEKFICSYVKWNNIQDALKDQGLKCWNGEIIEIPQENENLVTKTLLMRHLKWFVG